MNKDIDVIVFDLGGVLVELGEFPIKAEWLSEQSQNEQEKKAWIKSELAQAFEQGSMTADEFATAFIQDRQLLVSKEEFITHFSQWPIGPYDGVHETVTQLRRHYPLAIFSNTNELHWHRLMHEMKLDGLFDHYFASHLIQQAKPNPDAFEYIARQMGIQPGKILFLDDTTVNVEAARKAGFLSEQVIGFDAVVTYLKKHNMLYCQG